MFVEEFRIVESTEVFELFYAVKIEEIELA